MAPHTFHVVIATLGRPSLQRMLDSLLPQLLANDALTIVWEGHSARPSAFTLHGLACPLFETFHPTALGFWGHAARNTAAPHLERRDFVMHADDDDVYDAGAFDALRAACSDRQTLYIAQMRVGPHVFPRFGPVVREGNVGTPMGIVPFDANKLAIWEHRCGGDGVFFQTVAKHTSVHFLPILIYTVRP